MRAVLAGTRPSDEQYRDYYRGFHDDLESVTEKSLSDFTDASGRNSYQRLAEAIDPRTLANLLDLGCGDGLLLAEVIALNPAIVVSGVDLSQFEVDRARSRLPCENVGGLVVADATNVPFADATFDAVTSHMMLMLIPNLEPVLAEIVRVLKPTKRFVGLVPRRADPGHPVAELLRLVHEWVRELHPGYQPVNPGDPRAWNTHQLIDAMTNAGLVGTGHLDFEVRRSVDAGRLWPKLAGRYYVGSLPETTQQHVRERASAWIGMGQIDYVEALRIVFGRRR